MYMCYDKLWQLLVSKKLSKTDLCRLTGISSRTMAKLSKNESVTTDTLLSICSVLNCNIGDIVEVKEGASVTTIYEAYLAGARKVGETEACNIFEFEFNNIGFTVYALKKSANKRTVIHCTPEGAVTAEQLYPLGLHPVSEITSIFHSSLIVKGRVTVVLVTGAPGNITGLDNGCVHSARYGCLNEGFYVMSMSAFKLFEMKK